MRQLVDGSPRAAHLLSRADLQRQTAKSPGGLAAQIPIFCCNRSRSTVERASPVTKFVVPVRAVRSPHSSNHSSSRYGRSNLSQSRKAHPSESRYSNRSFLEKSGRHHDVEIEDLKPEAPPPVLLSQDSSVYPSTVQHQPSFLTLMNFYSAMIVLSCWLPVLALFSIRKDSPSRRLGCVAVTLALDVVAVLVLPIEIMHLYTKLHNAQKQHEALPQQHGDEWLLNCQSLAAELQSQRNQDIATVLDPVGVDEQVI